MKPRIAYILVGAAKRRGKDTFAKYLQEVNKECGDSCVVTKVYSFAEALREELSEALTFSGIDLDVWTDDPVLKEQVIRPLLIAWGQMRRHQDENYWVKQLIEKVNQYAAGFEENEFGPMPDWLIAVVSDWRFLNELRQVQKTSLPVFAVHIDRPGVPYAGPDEAANDPICKYYAPFRICNDGDLEYLKAQAGELLRGQILPNLLNYEY